MATAYEPEEESPTLAAPEEDCEESEGVDDTVDLEKRTEINLKDIEENNGLLRGLNKLTREKKLEQVSKYVNWDDQVSWVKKNENKRRFYHRKLDLSYDLTNSDMHKKETGDVIFYYLTKEVEPDEHACDIIGGIHDHRGLGGMHKSWISDCSWSLGDEITFAQFYSRVGNKWAALEQFVYKHKALMLNKHSGFFLRNLKDALPYVTFYKMMTGVRDENGQTAMFFCVTGFARILFIFEHSTDDLYELLSIQDNNGQTALHVKPEPVLNLLQFSYRTKLRQKTLNLFNIKDNNNKIAVDLIEDDLLKYELTKFVDQVEQNKYFLILKPKVLIVYTTKGRDGAEEEADTICDAFESKTNRNITGKKDKTKEEMLKLIKEASRGVQSAALIVIIMSHGSVGAIHDSEGKAVTLTSIEDAMCANERNKDLPKILITQCCQETDDQPSARDIAPSAPSSETDGPTPSKESRTPYVPKNDHFCAIMSCVSGQESTRGVFIPKLAEEINRSKRQESIIDLAVNVSSAMEEEGYEEIPIVMNTLRGKLTLDTPDNFWCTSKI